MLRPGAPRIRRDGTSACIGAIKMHRHICGSMLLWTVCVGSEIKGEQNFSFHIKHHLLGELVFGDSDEVPEIWRVYLLIFGSDQESGDTQEVELVLQDLLLAHVLINNMNCDVKGLWH